MAVRVRPRHRPRARRGPLSARRDARQWRLRRRSAILADGLAATPSAWRIRLVAKDIALSRRRSRVRIPYAPPLFRPCFTVGSTLHKDSLPPSCPGLLNSPGLVELLPTQAHAQLQHVTHNPTGNAVASSTSSLGHSAKTTSGALPMTAVNPSRQKVARSALDKISTDAPNVSVIHYSCEGSYDIHEGRSPRITSIALRNLDTAQTSSFSIHKVAETKGVPLSDISKEYDSLEREILQAFYRHLGNYQQMQYLHWNMRDSNYGFQAIEHRFRVLGGTDEDLYIVDDQNKTDLARLLVGIYGLRYIGHPRLEQLLKKNDISRRDFLTGAEEAEAFENMEFVALHRSTLRKVDVMANIAGRAHDRSLKTNATWWDMHGGRIVWVFNGFIEHPIWGFAGFILAIVIASAAIVY